MKRNIINLLLVGFFLAAIIVIGINTVRADGLADNPLVFQEDPDPNEPMPEFFPEMTPEYTGFLSSEADPNGPILPPESYPEVIL